MDGSDVKWDGGMDDDAWCLVMEWGRTVLTQPVC